MNARITHIDRTGPTKARLCVDVEKEKDLDALLAMINKHTIAVRVSVEPASPTIHDLNVRSDITEVHALLNDTMSRHTGEQVPLGLGIALEKACHMLYKLCVKIDERK